MASRLGVRACSSSSRHQVAMSCLLRICVRTRRLRPLCQKAKADLRAKDATIAENLRVARSEKETFDRELAAAREEIARFREMVESQANLDESFKVKGCCGSAL